MKLQCNNCESGPCSLESNSELKFNEHNRKRCYFKGCDIAYWKELSDPVTASEILEAHNKKELSPKPEWPKESELMTLQEAIPKMKIGDVFKVHNPLDSNYQNLRLVEDSKGAYFNSEGCTCVSLRPCFLSAKGQIIPAEPKVLSAEEWFKKHTDGKFISNNKEASELIGLWACSGFEAGHQNGRLERDLEITPLIDAVLNYKDDYKAYEIMVIKVLQNLKPLKAE